MSAQSLTGGASWQPWFDPAAWSWERLVPEVATSAEPDRTLTACVGKTRFEAFRNADAAARRMSSRTGKRAGTRHRAKAYRCPVCGGYHIAKASRRGRIKTVSGRW